jgi:hypothetical protein
MPCNCGVEVIDYRSETGKRDRGEMERWKNEKIRFNFISQLSNLPIFQSSCDEYILTNCSGTLINYITFNLSHVHLPEWRIL